MTTNAPSPADDIALRDRDAEKGLIGGYLDRLKSGELGSLPVILGVIIVWAVFYFQNSNFLTAFNLTNLTLQSVAYAVAASGIVLVLLLGEIDLALGSVAGLCAAICVVMNLDHGVPGVVAVLLGVLAGAAAGFIHGAIIAWIIHHQAESLIPFHQHIAVDRNVDRLGQLPRRIAQNQRVTGRNSLIVGR